MSSNTTECHVCGHHSSDPEWCDECGSPLTPQDEWLGPGAKIDVRCDISALGLEGVSGEVHFEVELLEEFEASSVRHISSAKFSRLIEASSEAPEDIEELLLNQLFTLEELSSLLGGELEVLPAAVAHLVRTPIVAVERGDHHVHLFRDDGSMSLEEYAVASQQHLDYHEIKQIFTALMDLVEQLHEQDYLYLRLSPWTLRLIGTSEHSLIGGLGNQETFVEEDEAGKPVDTFEDFELPTDLSAATMLDDAPAAKLSDSPEASELVSGSDAFSNEPSQADAEQEDEDELDLHDDADDTAIFGAEPSDPSLDDILSGASIVQRAILDGGTKLYTADRDYDEIPVVEGFSPPEMFGRTRADLGPHCDIFSLGMLLYFLITAELPPTSIYTRHTPAIPARHFRPDFPIGFQRVIGRATRPDPDQRFDSIEAMRSAFTAACTVIERRLDAARMGSRVRVDLTTERHIGITKRLRNPINQDNVFGQRSENGEFSLIVVADGVSTASYGSGDLASQQLKDVANEQWPALLSAYNAGEPLDEFDIIYKLLDEANRRIVDYVNNHHLPFAGNPHEVMGTTALVAIVLNGIVTLGSLGDSRAYLQRGPSFEQITIDHNLWTLRVLDGVRADTALSLPHGDALARCLGTFYINEHRLSPIAPQPDIFRFPVIPGDTLLLTTDGLIDFAGSSPLNAEDNILSLMLAEPNPNLAALELILLANRGGGGDNIGIGLLKFI